MLDIQYKPHVSSKYNQLFSDGKYDEAIQIMRTFCEQCERESNPYGAMLAHINIASCYYYLGQIESTIQSVLSYKLLCDDYGGPYEQYYLCRIQALIYEYEQNYIKAKNTAQECIRLAEALNLPYELSKNYCLLSNLHIMTEHYTEALSFAQKALLIAETQCEENMYLRCQIYCSLAATYVHLEQFTEAKDILDLLAQDPFIQNNQLERSRYLLTKGIFTMKYEVLQDAITYFKDAEKIAESFLNHILLKKVYSYTALSYEQQRQFEKAYDYLKKYVEKIEETHKEHLLSR